MVKMVASGKEVSVIHHDGHVHRPARDGSWEVADHLVPVFRSHGLVPVHEVDAVQAKLSMEAELKALRDGAAAGELRIQELEQQLTKAVAENAELREQLAAAQGAAPKKGADASKKAAEAPADPAPAQG